MSQLDELFAQEDFNAVAKIIKNTFKSSSGLKNPGRRGRPIQLGMLMHSLWMTDIVDCFVWTEECLNEAMIHYIRPTTPTFYDKWILVLDKCLCILLEIIKMETVCISKY